MRRLHLFELEDQHWLPAQIRDGITDFLQFAVVRADLYGRASARLSGALRRTGDRRVVDLCSGGGGPWAKLHPAVERQLAHAVDVRLTDYFPNLAALRAVAAGQSGGRITACEQPISALAVPQSLQGFRTVFSAFHHFQPAQAQAILADAVGRNAGIAVFESTQRHPLLLLYMLLTPLLVLLTSPFQKPWRWGRMFWTYVVPAVPLAVLFDGIVSCLRTYTPPELLAMAREVPGSDRYDWEAGVERIGGLPVGVTYLIGTPRTPLAAGCGPAAVPALAARDTPP